MRTFKLANVYSEAFCKKFTEAKSSGKTKVILYGESYIKFIIKYACMETGLEFEQKETSAQVLLNALCVVGELNDDEVQKYLIQKGCLSLVEMVETK